MAAEVPSNVDLTPTGDRWISERCAGCTLRAFGNHELQIRLSTPVVVTGGMAGVASRRPAFRRRIQHLDCTVSEIRFQV